MSETPRVAFVISNRASSSSVTGPPVQCRAVVDGDLVTAIMTGAMP